MGGQGSGREGHVGTAGLGGWEEGRQESGGPEVWRMELWGVAL